jgi:hypothetical protein
VLGLAIPIVIIHLTVIVTHTVRTITAIHHIHTAILRTTTTPLLIIIPGRIITATPAYHSISAIIHDTIAATIIGGK